MKATKTIAKIAGAILVGMMALSFASCNEKNGGSGAVGADGLTKAQAKILKEKPAPEADFEIELSDDRSYVTVTKYKGKSVKTLVIPSTIQGVPVKIIKGNVFSILHGTDAADTVQNLVISEGTEQIGSYAFQRCGELTTVVLPSTLKKIGYVAFNDCEKLTTINFPEGLVFIKSYAFSGTGLKEINLPEGLLYLGAGAFNGNENLTALSLPSSLRYIEYNNSNTALAGNCDKLEQITIPEGISVLYVYVGSYVRSRKGDFSELITGTKIKESVALQQLLKSRTIEYATDEQLKEFTKLSKEYGWDTY